ncbi:PREDICTED: peptidyl-tRNA hydrolase 2, mitochondrial-like isoform X2 [Populus euphratica]|uniref:peptidyl-tRNA hydrolase n=1 Tax=Populus euphratica TaxID=75702 RepID=A0AAJ6TAD8_POPEU|nr:PREDICTED: peptidyl-tRNA hydrolase 2, mitochondrial-like isoform X2 [Populus euphratica]
MDLSWLSAILVGACCLALGYCIGTRRPFCFFLRLTPKVVRDTDTNPSSHHGNKNINSKEPLETDKLADILDDFKMVLVVRNDLKMGKGKIAAQCRWEMCAQPKVVVKIESEEDMLVLQDRAKSLNLPTHITIDAGRTQIAPNSRTVMAILGKSFRSSMLVPYQFYDLSVFDLFVFCLLNSLYMRSKDGLLNREIR